MKQAAMRWLPIAVMTLLLSGLILVVARQQMRMSANDPQMQMADDISIIMAGGADPASVVPHARIDIAKSMAPYTVVYDESGRILASSGELKGHSLSVPEGVLTHARQTTHNEVTWEPEPGVRQALVVRHFTGNGSGFVLVGRSLSEVERRQGLVLNTIVSGLLVTELATFVAALLCWRSAS